MMLPSGAVTAGREVTGFGLLPVLIHARNPIAI